MSTPQINEGAATKPSAPSQAAQPGVSWLSKLIGVQGPLIGLVVLCIFFSFSTSGAFFSVRNALNVLDQVTVLGILSLGMTAVIISGGIDLSVGSVLAFAMMVTGWLSHDCGLPLLLAILVGLIVGAACGLGNGFLVTRAKLPPFIATLSMMTITRGLANIITDGRQIVGYPAWFDNLATVRYLGFFSITVVLFILLVILGWLHLGYRAVRRSLYAIGGSRKWRGLPASASETLPPWYTSVLEFYRLWLGLCWPAGSTPPNPARLRQDVVFAL